MFSKDHIRTFLEESLSQAKIADENGNYPIGAIVVNDTGDIVSKSSNECASTQDITAHAEIQAIRELGDKLEKNNGGSYYLFSSLEPCFGCSFFLARTNIKAIYSALKDPHKGGVSDLKMQDQFEDFFANIEVINESFEDLKEESKKIMKKYFQRIGNNKAAEFYS